jgi:hypothetical protein
MGKALSPSQYAAAGASFKDNYIDPVSTDSDPAHVFAGLGQLYTGFRQGGPLDAQPNATGDITQRASYANYVFGVYFASAGIPLDEALSSANAYGYIEQAWGIIKRGRNPYRGKAMNPVYGGIPTVNVQNITQGYNDQLNGTTCQ